jgi:hypothetical protein
MNKQLKNTAVKVENKQQVRCVVALVELVTGRKSTWSKSDFEWAASDLRGWILINKNVHLTYDDEPRGKIITLEDLVWGYGLAPDWAVCLLEMATGDFRWGDGKIKSCALNGSDIDEGHRHTTADSISTRPKSKSEINSHWNGEGLPPVGVECEVIREHEPIEVAHIKFIDNDVVFYNLSSEGMQHVHSFAPLALVKFRPLKTERDEFIERLKSLISLRERDGATTVCGEVYDAGARFTD